MVKLTQEQEAAIVAELDMAPGERLALDALRRQRSLGLLPDEITDPFTGECLDLSAHPSEWAEPARALLQRLEDARHAGDAARRALSMLATRDARTQHLVDYGLAATVTVERPTPRYSQDALRSVHKRYRGLLSTLAAKGHQVLGERTELTVSAAALRALANFNSEPVQNLLAEISDAQARPGLPRVRIGRPVEDSTTPIGGGR